MFRMSTGTLATPAVAAVIAVGGSPTQRPRPIRAAPRRAAPRRATTMIAALSASRSAGGWRHEPVRRAAKLSLDRGEFLMPQRSATSCCTG
jgi:hypothetical protein